MSAAPVFIVGVPRSGTTLLAAMLAAHSGLSCGPETHFFRWLSRVDPGRLCDRADWPRPAVEFLASIRPTGIQSGNNQTLPTQYQIDESGLAAYLQGREPSIAAILSSVTEQYMTARLKRRWVEKTPDHLTHLAAIRTHFPASPIIRITRDPRDVALSLMNVPWGARTFLDGLLYWDRLHDQSRTFFATDLLCHTIRFEDLVVGPVQVLQEVCGFIGEAFEDGMLDTSRTGAEVNGERVPWKRKASETVDVGRAAVWRSRLTRRENQLAEAVVGDAMEALGYPREESYSRLAEVFPRVSLAAAPPGTVAAVAAEGVRFWAASPDERPTARVYVGDPGTTEWLGEGKAERALRALPVAMRLLRAAVAGDAMYWIPGGSAGKWGGWLSFLLKRWLARHEIGRAVPDVATGSESDSNPEHVHRTAQP